MQLSLIAVIFLRSVPSLIVCCIERSWSRSRGEEKQNELIVKEATNADALHPELPEPMILLTFCIWMDGWMDGWIRSLFANMLKLERVVVGHDRGCRSRHVVYVVLRIRRGGEISKHL